MVVVAFAFILEDFGELFIEYFCVEKYITGYEYEAEYAQSYMAAVSSISLNLVALLCFIAFIKRFRSVGQRASPKVLTLNSERSNRNRVWEWISFRLSYRCLSWCYHHCGHIGKCTYFRVLPASRLTCSISYISIYTIDMFGPIKKNLTPKERSLDLVP